MSPSSTNKVSNLIKFFESKCVSSRYSSQINYSQMHSSPIYSSPSSSRYFSSTSSSSMSTPLLPARKKSNELSVNNNKISFVVEKFEENIKRNNFQSTHNNDMYSANFELQLTRKESEVPICNDDSTVSTCDETISDEDYDVDSIFSENIVKITIIDTRNKEYDDYRKFITLLQNSF